MCRQLFSFNYNCMYIIFRHVFSLIIKKILHKKFSEQWLFFRRMVQCRFLMCFKSFDPVLFKKCMAICLPYIRKHAPNIQKHILHEFALDTVESFN